MHYKALIFDLDDTLFPEREYVRSGFHAVDAWLQETHHTPGFFPIAWQLFEGGLRGVIFDRALEQLNIPSSKLLIDEMVTVYRTHPPQISLFDDAKWALEYFHGKLKLGIITDGYKEAQVRKVRALDLERYMDIVIYTDDFGRECWKPHTKSFEHCSEELGIVPSSCVYIGDNPTKDFTAPKRLGWTTIYSRRTSSGISIYPEHCAESDRNIGSLLELKLVLDVLNDAYADSSTRGGQR